MNFGEDLDIRPLPVAARDAHTVATSLQADIDAAGGDLVAAATVAADAVIAQIDNEPPSELGRLWMLYATAYTRAELERLATNSYRSAGLGG